MPKYDFKEGDIVRFTDNRVYNYTNEERKTVAKVVSTKDYLDYNPYYVQQDDELLVKIIAMDSVGGYEMIISREEKGIFPVRKNCILPYKGEYDDIPNVKMLLLQNGYGKDKIKKLNKRKNHDINSVLLEGF